ncbi:nucleotidyltransferase [Neisseria sp. HMSC068C04]|uniref:nucleotide-binding domain-containing protein n=1 Tax=Neisseria sp. HMSC068C04 TaxID=1715179 RepID=UPI0008A35943|nr:nucleotidyltransferase [Neisseria sp. HMSC068C04]OFM28046.1 nucleotidyltransferase [Neisseria sp. HMSC068C04]
MSISQMFEEFIDNLAISNKQTISDRYAELTKTLNKQFRNTDSETANTLQVGSFGRKTGINGISDLDMLYIMPKSTWDTYKNAQYKLLSDTKEAILNRYSRTAVSVDRLVVTVTFSNFYIEVQPVFEQEDGSFKYPDTKDGGSWKITKPREEIDEISSADKDKNQNLRRLCKMARAWKNKHGVAMGGLLIDTLVYNFLKSTDYYDDKSFSYYDLLSRDFFQYLSKLPEQTEYAVLGSKQRVKVKKKFQQEAKKALKVIDAENQSSVNDKWKKIYGRPFPAKKTEMAMESLSASYSQNWQNTEEFIEDKFPIDIREYLKIDCEVKQNGFRKFFLREILKRRIPLKSRKDLLFEIKEISVHKPYEIYWKVLNRGEEAKKRNCIRGQIVPDRGYECKKEATDFYGDHIVECYCIKNGVVVAKDRIHVPIVTDGSDYD